ncbi:MAG: lipase family protein [Gammaproteobacteria bacterium]|nr:lipase family protein [Gammaproteobacteria bacterium]
MPELSPRKASELAKEVYFVQSESNLPFFLARPEFSSSKSDKKHLVAEVGGRLLRTAKDGFGVCALGGKGYEKDLFLIFRGSTFANSNADWISNGRIGVQISRNGLPVHIGFNSIFNSMLPSMKQFLQPIEDIQTIHCIGHSLGGAIATLTADWIRSNKNKTVKLYTFGAPKTGLILFATNLSRKLGMHNIYRTYHATDPVPMIPLFPYVHPPLPGFGHYIASSEAILSADAHDMSKYVHSLKEASWRDLERRAPPYSFDNAVEQWLQSKYAVNESSPKIWQWINAALIYVLKKILGPVVHSLQTGFMGLLTLADMIAWALRKGIEFFKQTGEWVKLLMRKIMQVLGMKLIDETEDFTQAIMRRVLTRLMERTNELARRAIMRIS